MRPRLHALDRTVVQEICSAGVFGQLGDAELARLLPLLLQRHTAIGDGRVRLIDTPLLPRAVLSRTAQGRWQLALHLQRPPSRAALMVASARGEPPPAPDSLALAEGRLLCGAEAFFMRANAIYPVASPSPWLLAPWGGQGAATLSDAQLSPEGRDQLISQLVQAGVPQVDLESLAVQRGPPEGYTVVLTPGPEHPMKPHVLAQVIAHYGFGDVQLVQSPTDVYADVATAGDAAGPQGLGERDLTSEEEAREILRRAGLRHERGGREFFAQAESALALLDPRLKILPAGWNVDRSGCEITFHQDLALNAQVRMVEKQSLLDVRLEVATVDDDRAVAALIDMKDLLAWLKTGSRYVRLQDGSWAAPSQSFRRSLRILDDLGAQGDRALVSPLCIGLLKEIGHHSALSAVDEATRAWLAELSNASEPLSVKAPRGLHADLRDYQARGLDWLMMLHRHRLTGILADDMGLGKTLQTLALLLLVRQESGPMPSLVVAPTSVVTVWRDEAERFAPSLEVALWYGPPQLRRALRANDVDLVVTTYGILRRDAELLKNINFRYVILDESQSAKNASSQNARAIRELKSERRLALSGTPLENRPEELWSIFDFLAPGFLGSLRRFRRRYAQPIQHGDEEALSLLRLRLGPLVLRRLKSEVAQELPEKVETISRCDMGPAQRALYEHVAGELRDSIKSKIAKAGIQGAQLDILAALTRLRQICCDPGLLPAPSTSRPPPSAKLELFEQLMREALASERCVVVFSQFVQMQTRLIKVVEKLGVKPLWLHGGSQHRDRIVANFQDPAGPPVIVVSLRAGGTGVTLTRADTVVHYDPWWNPAVEQQATDRAHRLGQKRTVNVYKLICARSIEEKVLGLAAAKREVASKLLVSEVGKTGKRITQEEVMALLSTA